MTAAVQSVLGNAGEKEARTAMEMCNRVSKTGHEGEPCGPGGGEHDRPGPSILHRQDFMEN